MGKASMVKSEEGNVNVPVKSTPSAMPAFLGGVKMSGKGVSTDAGDVLIPQAKVLQKGSPQVERRSADYVPGAEAGKIYIKNAPQQIYDGEEGFLFQPCHFKQGVVEWIPRNKGGGGGQGFVALHAEMPADAESKPDQEHPEKFNMTRPNGNICIDTRYHSGYIIREGHPPMPCVIPFSSTGHSVSRQWMFLMTQKVDRGAIVDSWCVLYRFKTKLRSKGSNTWFVFDVSDAGPEVNGLHETMWISSLEDYERGRALNAALESGEQKIDLGDGPADEGHVASEVPGRF
jgi:hypothetical protein